MQLLSQIQHAFLVLIILLGSTLAQASEPGCRGMLARLRAAAYRAFSPVQFRVHNEPILRREPPSIAAAELKAAVDWAKENEMAFEHALRRALMEKNRHVAPLVSAFVQREAAYAALGSRSFQFELEKERLEKLVPFAYKHGAHRQVLFDLAAYGAPIPTHRLSPLRRDLELVITSMQARPEFEDIDWEKEENYTVQLLKLGFQPSYPQMISMLGRERLDRALVPAFAKLLPNATLDEDLDALLYQTAGFGSSVLLEEVLRHPRVFSLSLFPTSLADRAASDRNRKMLLKLQELGVNAFNDEAIASGFEEAAKANDLGFARFLMEKYTAENGIRPYTFLKKMLAKASAKGRSDDDLMSLLDWDPTTKKRALRMIRMLMKELREGI